MPSSASPQADPTPIPINAALRFEHYSLEEGLSQSTVLAMLQDRQGFLWIGTQDGLNRFDGYSFTVFKNRTDDPFSLSHSSVIALYEDDKGFLWVGTWGGGLNRYDPISQNFTRYQHNPNKPGSLPNDTVTSILEDEQGQLWVGTCGGGLAALDRETGLFRSYTHSPSDDASLSSAYVSALAPDGASGLWVGTGCFGYPGAGLNHFDPATGRAVRYLPDPADPQALASGNIAAIARSSDGSLWIATGGYTLTGAGLHQLDPKSGIFSRYQHDPKDPASLAANDLLGVMVDASGLLWVGTWGGGLSIADTNTAPLRFYNHRNNPFDPTSLSSDLVWSFMQDRTGLYWIGTANGGLEKLDPQVQRFRLYRNLPNDETTLASNTVGPLVEDQDGMIWVGTLGSGLDRFDPTANTFAHYLIPESDPLAQGANTYMGLTVDALGTLWAGTLAGLARFDKVSERFTYFRNDPTDPGSLANNTVSMIVEDSARRLWVGTFGGLELLDRQTMRFTHMAIPAMGQVVMLFLDREGFLWVGTWGTGLFQLDLNSLSGDQVTYRRFANDPANPYSLVSNAVWSAAQSPDGTLWFATGLGLERFEAGVGTFTHFQEQDGLSNNTALCLRTDAQGVVWVSTNDGLTRFNPADGHFRIYRASDGLQSSEFTSGSCLQTRRGELYFGGMRGISAFRPEQVTGDSAAPPVAVSAFNVQNIPQRIDLSGANPIEVDYTQNFISFEFVALDFRAPALNRYTYRLEGFDRAWVDAGTRRYASYTNLASGQYTFHVRAANADGVWNETGIAIPLVINPPFWRTWWFGLIVSLLGLGFVAAGMNLRTSMIRRQNERLAEMVSQRTVELRETNVQLSEEVEQRKRAEAALAERSREELAKSEARFRAMFDFAAVGISMLNLDRSIIDTNPATCRMLGYSHEEMLGIPYASVVHPNDLNSDADQYRQLIAGTINSYLVEKRYLRKDGTYRWGRATLSTVRGTRQEVLFVVSMLEDITEQKVVQEELVESEARFSAMYQNAQVGIMLAYVDPRYIESAAALTDTANLPGVRSHPLDMAVLQAEQPEVYDELFGLLVNSQRLNPALQHMFGYNADELRTIIVTDMIYPEDRGLDRQFFSEMITGTRDSYRVEKRYVAKDGRVFWARLTCSLARRADGSPSMIIGIIEDIDAERRTQEALMQSEARFRAMFDEAPVGMALMSLESKIIQANQSLAHLTGYTLEELINMAPVDVVHPDYRYSDNELFEELLAGKRSHYQMEKRYVRKDGTIFWGRVNYALVRSLAGEPLYLVGIMEDIDDARRAAEKMAQQEAEYRSLLEQRVEERTLALQQANARLTGEIEQRRRAEEALAHQAADDAVAAERNRLARDLHDAVTQTLFSASLLAEVIPELMKINVKEAYRRLDELRQLTRGALAEMRTLLLELRPAALTEAALPDLLRQLTEAVIGRARLPVELAVEGSCLLPPEVQVTFYRIAQEALNNVVKYARAGQVVVSLRCTPEQVRLAVMDNGAGFDPEAVTATHMGMRIMRERAEAVGAKLMIDSAPGEGTQVSVTWTPPG